MSQLPLIATASLGVLVSFGLVACQSTQETSDIREAEAVELAKAEAFRLGSSNKELKIVSTEVITDDYGTAVAVELQNTGKETQVAVPILIEVRDAKGKSVYRNDVAGLEPSLNHVQLVKPGETVAWVNDQIQATGNPESVEVKVGAPTEGPPGQTPELAVSQPRLNVDSSGIEVEGTVTNKSQLDQAELILYAVARSGGKIIAAGRGQIKDLKPDAKPGAYNVFFIGDPRSGEIEVTAPPTVFE